MFKTFYSEFRDENPTSEKEWKEQMLALAMSHHERLGTLSSFRQVGSDMIRTIGQMIPIVPLPPLGFVDDDEHYLQTEQTGIYGVRFDPQDVRQVDMTLLLHITVSLPGHPIETIFSGNVIPRMSDGYLGIKTPRSKQGYYHKIFIERNLHGGVSIKVVFMNDRSGERRYYGGQSQENLSNYSLFINQDTPQGLSAKIWSLETISSALPSPLFQWPSPWVEIEEGNRGQTGFFYVENRFDLPPRYRTFGLSLSVGGNVVFKKPLVNPEGSSQWTVGCRNVSGGFNLNGTVRYIVDSRHKCLELQVDLYHTEEAGISMWGPADYGRQCWYLDEPEELQHLRQDLLNGYISFRVERLADGWADS